MPTPSLQDIFRRALQAAVVAPLAVVGCGPNTTGYSAPACEGGYPSMQGLTPSVIPDVVQLRSVMSYGGGGMREAPVTHSSAGTACATATDAGACTAALAALAPDGGFSTDCIQICSDYHLATTKGDEVKAITTYDDLVSFLAPIDAANEATLLVFANNYNLACDQLDRGAVKPNGTAWDVIATRGFACGEGTAVTRHFLSVSREGVVKETGTEIIERGQPNCAIGRRPPGLVSEGRSACDEAVGRFFAEATHLEAASVPAFAQLCAELALHGAPPALRDAALQSILEEVAHTQATAALAARFGAEPVAPAVKPAATRSLFGLALDNAVEGCVRETFGALVAHHQAAHAQDEVVRTAMAQIAQDETRHAELSWAIDAWAREQLPLAERLALDEARAEALAALRRELAAPVDAALVETAGVPPAVVALGLLDLLEAGLRAAA